MMRFIESYLNLANKKRSNRDVYHGEVIEFLHREGAWTRSEMTSPFIHEEPGSADIMVHIGGKAAAIEVKTGFNNLFAFSNWRENQRKWMVDYEYNTGCLYWLAIVIESDKIKVKGLRKPRAAFLLMGSSVLFTELMFTKLDRQSIPCYSDTKADALNIWQANQLVWDKGGWVIPKDHVFSRMYVMEK